MRKIGLLIIACALMIWYGATHFQLEDDPIRSLGLTSDFENDAFKIYHENSFFNKKIFIDVTDLSAEELKTVETATTSAHYTPVPTPQIDTQDLWNLVSQIPPADIERALSDTAIARRAEKLFSYALLPGSDAILHRAESDPFGLLDILNQKLAALVPPNDGRIVRAYQSPQLLSYNETGKLYDLLQKLEGKLSFIGGDFYSLENYRAVNSDVTLCATLALLLNFALFYFFTRRISLLVLLGAGSVVSYITGFFAVGVFYGTIYAIVIAFTSTFVGFNNESLVHLSGLERSLESGGNKSRARIIGVWSAIGTTVLGFVMLLPGRSVLVRQMALAALGGTFGFLAFLFMFKKYLSDVKFRHFRVPNIAMPRRVLALLASVGIAGIFAAPKIATSIDTFRFESPTLSRQTKIFESKLKHSNLGEVVGLKVPVTHISNGLSNFWNRLKNDYPQFAPHPLDLFQNEALQNETLARLRHREAEALPKLQRALEAQGLRLALVPPSQQTLQTLSDQRYLKIIEHLAPLKWHAQVNGNFALFAGWEKGEPPPAGSITLNPAHHYNTILTNLSVELAVLFALGLTAMIFYLAFVQRNFWRILYIVTPVFLCGGFFAMWGAITQTPLNIIHFMGLALTIALAMDYTSVAVSTRHDPEDLAKIVLTGLSSLITFGVLIFAQHPVLRSLGFTVGSGCAIGLVFALFFPLREDSRGPASRHGTQQEPIL
jgi:hypothetical protein